ncbi:MAG: ATP-binding cassette domain-containing protein [Patescibacteria group bacterium]
MISVRGLTKKFGNHVAVDDISFDVADGEIFAFLGPNGAGKTTTVKLLTTLLRPTVGEIRLNGFDPVHESAEARRTLGIVFQDSSLDDELTAFENLEFHGVLYGVPKKDRRERIDQLLAFVGLNDRRSDLVKTFSGGMKRRLEIARGFLHHPKILFLDEPTLGLDPQTRRHIWEYVRQLNSDEGTTVFLTTHHMEEAERMADRVAVIDQGRLVTQGTIADLKAQTSAANLEDAFIALTGKDLRDEKASSTEVMRTQLRAHRR